MAPKKYNVTRINGLARKNQPKRAMRKAIRCRYLAKSQLIRCDFSNAQIEYTNLKGAIIKSCSFKDSMIIGCDFFGTNFNGSNFSGVTFKNVIFVAVKIDKCNFNQAKFENTIFINTNITKAKNLNIGEGVIIFKKYPQVVLPTELWEAIEDLKSNIHFFKTKVLHLPGNRYNELNILLLIKRFGIDNLLKLLRLAAVKINKDMVSYSFMEKELNNLRKI